MSPHMAPKVGFEPTTYRLTAGCSTFELLRINNWLWPTLPRPFGLSTISDEELNFCVRYGNRCILFSIITILFLSIDILRITSLSFISLVGHVALVRSLLTHSLASFCLYLNRNNFHLLFKNIRFIGGDKEIRTPDPLLARQVLSQLSYAPISFDWYTSHNIEIFYLIVFCTIKTAYHLFSNINFVLLR